MHIKEKRKAVNKAFDLLNKNGIFVLSIDKNQSNYIDMGDRKINIYPDNKDFIKNIFSSNSESRAKKRLVLTGRFIII